MQELKIKKPKNLIKKETTTNPLDNLFQLSDYYQHYLDNISKKDHELINTKEIKNCFLSTKKKLEKFNHSNNNKYINLVNQFPKVQNCYLCNADNYFKIQSKNTDQIDKKKITDLLLKFSPWKIGPWQLFDLKIDSQWDCSIRFKTMIDNNPWLKDLTDYQVADIGCNNGNLLFQLLKYNPKFIVGFEPVIKHYFTFHIFQNYLKSPKIHFELAGYEHLVNYPKFFNLITCFGILYHHTDPIKILKICHNSLKKSGILLIDCEGIPGNESMSIMPAKKYAGCSGYWWLPTKKCLTNWIIRAGFNKVEAFHTKTLTNREQRKTKWAEIKTLDDFLDQKNSNYTIEGYPRPIRIYLKAIK